MTVPTHHDAQGRPAPMTANRTRPSALGFSLIEILVVISVILILMALTVPIIRLIHNSAYKSMALNLVSDLGSAMDEYKAEDPRKFYPTPPMPNQASANYLLYNPSDPNSVLNLLENHSTLKVDRNNLDQTSSDPYYNCLVDKWDRPIFYQLDGPYMAGAVAPYTLDQHLMNHVADRPVAAIGTVAAGIAPTWNSQGTEPFVYLWSTGVPTSNGDVADALPANWANWIYRSSSQ
jgi:prepilin-type N-terminal cleavage/methylation domain-containing protein